MNWMVHSRLALAVEVEARHELRGPEEGIACAKRRLIDVANWDVKVAEIIVDV
jgi:hypothetical protein